MAKELVFEIGTEEIPAAMVADLRENLAADAEEGLEENRLNYTEVFTYSTPRRLVLHVEGLAEEQEDKKEVIRGPSENIAFDEEGNPTKAAKGFARGQGVTLEEVEIRDGYLYVDKLIEGRPSIEVLSELLPELIENLSQPQTMRWGDKDFRFVRPIRWLTALLDDKVVEFELAGLESGRSSRGHRFLGADKIVIEKAGKYFSALEEEYVIVNQQLRREKILQQLKSLESQDRQILIRDELLEEVTNLVEFPTAFMGEFSPDFLTVPDEVLITSMIEHQRYFPVEKEDGLAPAFVGVRNGDEEHLQNVIKGNEMVIRARLADADFFYEEDRSVPLSQFNQALKDIVYQEGLGSIYDKIERLQEMSKMFSEKLDFSSQKRQRLSRAAKLCKFDLATDMVEEFPKLQGVMGRIYALDAGEREEVARAIEEHYLPAGSGDDLPDSDIAALLSIVDKIDDIASNFFVGNEPSGSHDPFALRRKAIGIIQILLDRNWQLSLQEIVERSIEQIEADSQTYDKVFEFLGERMHSLLSKMDIRYDVISAAMATDYTNVSDCWERCQAIMNLREINLEKFESLIHGLQRCRNLAAQGSPTEKVKEELLRKKEEQQLYDKYKEINNEIEKFLQNDSYDQALERIIDLVTAIDNFVDNVVVMVEEKEVRENRLALLQEVSNLIDPIMDIGEIALDEQ